MKINKISNVKNIQQQKPNFGGIGLSPVSNALYTLGNNDMLNASFVDVFAMDTPRTIVEFNHRGKQAGIEMGFREYTGTFIAEFSAITFATLASKIFTKVFKPNVDINSKTWVTNNGIDTFNEIYKNSDKTPKGFIKNTLLSMTGLSGKDVNSFKNDENLEKITEKFVNVVNNNLDKKSHKKALLDIQDEIINVLKADNSITVKSGEKSFSDNLSHVVRDMADVSKNVFFKKGVNVTESISKIKKLNKTRIAAAIPMSMALALSNQYINRQWTKSRTGIDNFVGENGYENNVNTKISAKKEKGLMLKKIVSAGVFVGMLAKVMGVKKPSDIVKKLEFNGPATGGNAIKTIYGTLILGRIFASKDSTELRETNVRDYLGFLNWLVFGGFVSKGVANLMDRNRKDLFNISKDGKGIGHWLKDISLKSQKEIIAQGGNVKKNLAKLNIAQIAGIGYSALMLGVLLPKLNIWMTQHQKTNKKELGA
ncbi:hypothetical protein IJ732_01770 [bacterium]|nr:hypothetical protein [bacterium]